MRLFAGIMFLLLAAEPVPAAEKLPPPVREFFDTHCVGCHSDTKAKAKLSVESLPANFDLPAWVRVHDRLAAHEMPPKGKPQPTPAERAKVTDWLARELTAAAVARQKTDGRVVFRRMNRREYETTLHDLLGISTPLQHLLPEDNPVHGFDTVSTGLETSSAHLLQYQRAAEVAVDAALPRGPVESKAVRITGKKYLEGRLPVHRKGIDPFVRVDGDALVLHARLYGDNSMQAPHPPVPGRYRVRASVRLVNADGRPMAVLVGKRVDRFQAEKLMHVVDYQDVQPGETRVIEAETDLGHSQGNQFIYFEGTGLPWFGDFAKQRGARANDPLDGGFDGPGLVIDWVELEGPLGAGLGVKRLFGDLPRVPNVPAGQKPPANWEKLPANDGHFSKWPLVAKPSDPKADADRLVRAFLPVAFRRPVSAELAGASGRPASVPVRFSRLRSWGSSEPPPPRRPPPALFPFGVRDTNRHRPVRVGLNRVCPRLVFRLVELAQVEGDGGLAGRGVDSHDRRGERTVQGSAVGGEGAGMRFLQPRHLDRRHLGGVPDQEPVSGSRREPVPGRAKGHGVDGFPVPPGRLGQQGLARGHVPELQER